jgi:hypothetical protein
MNKITIRVAPARNREARTALSRLPVILACTAVCSGAAVPEVRAATHSAAAYTPTLYVFQNDELIDVKTFKVADLEQCQHRASALLQLYLNHSDIEDDMRVVVKCVPVPSPSAGHRKGELPPDGERRERLTDVPEVTL